MSKGHVVVDGAICKCKFGATPDVLTVQSQTKAYINDSAASKKLIANTMDLGMPFQAKTFGPCKLKPTTGGHLPCVPAITQWQNPYDKVVLSNNGQILTENSKAACATSGSPSVEFTFHGQVATGAPAPPSAEEQEVISHLDPLASEIALEDVDGALPVQAVSHNDTVEETLVFKAYFNRTVMYNGEFGFDWMRQSYLPVSEGGDGIVENFEAFKKEYCPAGDNKVWQYEGSDYYVPWVAMFPKQEGVELLLNGCSYTEFIDITDADIVKLPEKNGVYFKDESGHKLTEVKCSEINDGGVFVTLCCDQPVTKDFVLELKDKNNKVVGKLNFFANANYKQLQFDITPVRVLRSISKESDALAIATKINEGFGDPNIALGGNLKKLENYINTNALNQALLQCNVGRVYDIVINEDEWITDGLIVEEGCVFKGEEILTKFYKEFEKKHPIRAKNRGLLLFLSPISNKDIGGKGELNNIDGKSLVLYESGLNDSGIFAHEISHVLGLAHSFQSWNKRSDIDYFNERIKKMDKTFQYMLDNNYSKETIQNEWIQVKDEYSELRSYLNLYYRNPHTFDQATTENFMDYKHLTEENEEGEKVTIRLNTKKRTSFMKFQWKAMQDDLIKFYSKKE